MVPALPRPCQALSPLGFLDISLFELFLSLLISLKLFAENLGFPGGSDGNESACSAGDLSLILVLETFPWKKAWQPTPVSLPGESPWTKEPGGLQSLGSQRVRHD